MPRPKMKYKSMYFDEYDCEHEYICVDGVNVCQICGMTEDMIDDDYSEEEEYVIKSTNKKLLDWGNKLINGLDAEEPVFKRSPPIISGETVYVKKKAFDKLRKLAFDDYIYKDVETAAVLYGKNRTIKKVKRFKCHQSAGLVAAHDPGKILKQINKRKFMGFFHSHLFNSSHMSGTDNQALNGWTAINGETFMLIGSLPHFKMNCWSMTDKFEVIRNPLIVV